RCGRRAGRNQGVVDRRQGLQGDRQAPRRNGSRGAGGRRHDRRSARAQGCEGVGQASGARRAGRRALLPRRPHGPGSGEYAGRSAGNGEAPLYQRRAGRDGAVGRQGAVASLGADGGEGSGSGEKADPGGVGSRLVIRFDVVTLLPEMFRAITESGITSRALERELWKLQTWNPRDFTTNNYRTVDDRPFGGGPGMVMLAEPLEKALDAVKAAGGDGKVIYLSPQGRKLDHRRVIEFSKENSLVLLCGRYE